MWAFAKISNVIIASGQNYLLQKPFKALNDALIISFLEMLLAGHSLRFGIKGKRFKGTGIQIE